MGRTLEEYLQFIGSPENLAREGTAIQAFPEAGPQVRRDFSAILREAYERRSLRADQVEAFRWLRAQPRAPTKMLVLAEEWSSDCRRDLPSFGRIAEALNAELRIFTRDGQRFSSAAVPSVEDAPDGNADLMLEFLNHKHGTTYQSIPVCAFFDDDFEYLYHYTEFPQIYEKDRVVMEGIRAPREGESREETQLRGDRDFASLIASPFWSLWTSAAVDEIASALHRRAVLGAA